MTPGVPQTGPLWVILPTYNDAGAGLLVEMDADLSHDPADLPRLVAAAGDTDLVLGSRSWWIALEAVWRVPQIRVRDGR